MFARARAFQEKQQEEANKNVENLFQLKIIVGGDSGNKYFKLKNLPYSY